MHRLSAREPLLSFKGCRAEFFHVDIEPKLLMFGLVVAGQSLGNWLDESSWPRCAGMTNLCSVSSQPFKDFVMPVLHWINDEDARRAASQVPFHWNWDVGAEFRISIKKLGLQGLRP